MFYGRLKELRNDELRAAVNEALKSVNLYNGGVGDRRVKTYSGGMKRRLSVAISLIGDPKVCPYTCAYDKGCGVRVGTRPTGLLGALL